MTMKQPQRGVYRSLRGKEVDMTKLINQNELTVAVGNVKVNARGDEIGPGGRIIRKEEDIVTAARGQNASGYQQPVINEQLQQSVTPPESPSSKTAGPTQQKPQMKQNVKDISKMDPAGDE